MHKGGTLMNRICALIKEIPKSFLTFPHVRTQQVHTRKSATSRTGPCWNPDLELLISRTGRDKCLLFKPHCLLSFVIAAEVD